MVFTLLREKVWSSKKYVVNEDCDMTLGTDKTHWTFPAPSGQDLSGHKKSDISEHITQPHGHVWICWKLQQPQVGGLLSGSPFLTSKSWWAQGSGLYTQFLGDLTKAFGFLYL